MPGEKQTDKQELDKQQTGQEKQSADQLNGPGEIPEEQKQPGDKPGEKSGESMEQPGRKDLPEKFTPEQVEQMKKLAEQMQDQLSEMSDLQDKVEKAMESDEQLQDLMRSLSESMADRMPPGETEDSNAAGSGEGEDLVKQTKRMDGYDKTMSREFTDAQGRPVSSWLSDKPTEVGESSATYEQSAREAVDEAERAISDDQLPSKYHPAVRQYFEKLPQTVEQAEGEEAE